MFSLHFNDGLYAQQYKTVTARAGEDLAQAYSPNGFYRFAQFSNGALYTKRKSGNSSQLFNYNILAGAMQYINAEGDTLEMINPSLFDSVMIDKTVFYYDVNKGFVELLESASSLRLVKKVSLKMKPVTVGGYDASSTTAAISRISTYTINNNVYNFVISDNMQLKENTDWFWVSERGNLVKATKKNLLSLLPAEKRKQAEGIIKDQKIDFGKEHDLMKLVLQLGR